MKKGVKIGVRDVYKRVALFSPTFMIVWLLAGIAIQTVKYSQRLVPT
jgi:hypothetical protein